MYIRSTLNIHYSVLKTIDKTASDLRISSNFLIQLLLKRAMLDYDKLINSNNRIKYQDRDPKKRWHTTHVNYSKDVYQFCLDMRSYYKFSVSYILAFSVSRHLYKILKEFLKIKNKEYLDNYPFSGYIFIQKTIKGALLWVHTWGIPQKPNILQL